MAYKTHTSGYGNLISEGKDDSCISIYAVYMYHAPRCVILLVCMLYIYYIYSMLSIYLHPIHLVQVEISGMSCHGGEIINTISHHVLNITSDIYDLCRYKWSFTLDLVYLKWLHLFKWTNAFS